MKIFKQVQVLEHQATICDRCGEEHELDYEGQEFVHIEQSCGFGSIFGDGKKIAIDLCQHCVKTLLGEHLRVLPPE